MVMPPSDAADENTAWLVSISMMSLYLVIDQYGPNTLSLAVVHRLFLAQPVEIGPERIGAKQFGVAGIELFKRNAIGAVPRRLLIGILNEIDGPVHRSAP